MTPYANAPFHFKTYQKCQLTVVKDASIAITKSFKTIKPSKMQTKETKNDTPAQFLQTKESVWKTV
jgi:hypothetical protein